jgi:hypothetical protein
MSQDDLEKRVAELERQLAEEKRGAELQRRLADAHQAAATGEEVVPATTTPLDQRSPRAGSQRPRTGLVGRTVGTFVIILLYLTPLLPPFIIGSSLAGFAPSTALWMSRIVCSSGYHMRDNSSHYSMPNGTSGSNMSFECVGAGGSYHINDLAVLGLQTLLVSLVLGAIIAVVILTRRVRRGSKLGVFWPCVLAAAAGCLALIGAVASQGLGVSANGSSTTSTSASSASVSGTITNVPRQSLGIQQTDSGKTIVCNDGSLAVDANSITVTVTGHCATLTVLGDGNHVNIDAADKIVVGGIRNVVIFHSGAPQIDTSLGTQYTVRQG